MTVSRVLLVVACILVSKTASFHPFFRLGEDYSEADRHYNWRLLDENKCGNSLSDRIIGGTNASLGQYPWLARIGYKFKDTPNQQVHQNISFRCGGSLINPCNVITAAHCVTGLPTNMIIAGVRLGEYDAEQDIDCTTDGYCADYVQDFQPLRIKMHKNYGNPSWKNDIALITLDREAVITSFVSPICLPRGNLLTKDLVGSASEVAGWGIYDLNIAAGSRILQTIRLPVVDRERCTEAFKRLAPVDDDQWCAGGVIGHDSCGGDSGGPLMKVDIRSPTDQPKYYLFGIVSFGAKYCGATTMPGVYTKIPKYMSWVLDNLEVC